MVKKANPPGSRRRPGKNKQTKAHQQRILDTIAELDRIEPQSAKVAAAISLFKSWLADESGYDEKTWPRLKKALERERERVGARRPFNG